MNPVEFTNVVPQAEDAESEAMEEFAAPRQSVRGARRDARLRYALLAGIALFSGWLAFTIHNSIGELERQVEMIRENIVSSQQ